LCAIQKNNSLDGICVKNSAGGIVRFCRQNLKDHKI
jgi:hypothetical protein